MKLNRLNSEINRDNRNKLNENMAIIENDFSNMDVDIKEYKEIIEDNSRLISNANFNANKARILAESVQQELDSIVVSGDSSVEAAQARTNSDTGVTYTNLRDRLDTENKNVIDEIDMINRVEVEIDVQNPPSATGLLGLTMNDPVTDKIRLQAIFDYIKANEVSYQPVNAQRTGYCYTLIFPDGIYEWSSSVNLKGRYLKLKADRAIIRVTDNSAAFKSTGSDGWKLDLIGFSFDRCDGLDQNNDNLEAGRTNIESCWFYYSKKAINLTKQSSHTYIEKSHFYKCEEIGYFDLTDAVYFKKVWINDAGRTTDIKEAITNKTRMYFEDTFFIPSGVTPTDTTEEIAWVANHFFVRFDNCRFSAEPGAMTVVNNYAEGAPQLSWVPNGVEVLNCEPVACNTGSYIIRLYAMPNVIRVNNNQMGPILTYPVGYAADYNTSDIDALVNNSYYKHGQIIVEAKDNIGQTSNMWTIPEKLKQFIRYEENVAKKVVDLNLYKTAAVNSISQMSCKIKGNRVTMSIHANVTVSGNTIIFTLPVGARPLSQAISSCTAHNVSAATTTSAIIIARNNGNLTVGGITAATYDIYYNLTYDID